jgi:hypothetical protein
MQNTSRFRDLQLRNNLGPLGKTLSKAMSGGAKAVSNGGVRLLRGVDAFWNEFEKGPSNDHEHGSPNQSLGSGKKLKNKGGGRMTCRRF